MQLIIYKYIINIKSAQNKYIKMEKILFYLKINMLKDIKIFNYCDGRACFATFSPEQPFPVSLSKQISMKLL